MYVSFKASAPSCDKNTGLWQVNLKIKTILERARKAKENFLFECDLRIYNLTIIVDWPTRKDAAHKH